MTTTALGDRGLRRALKIDGRIYTLTLDDAGFKLSEKGRRLGLEIRWRDLVSGEAALAVALNASLTAPLGDRRGRDGASSARRGSGGGRSRRTVARRRHAGS